MGDGKMTSLDSKIIRVLRTLDNLRNNIHSPNWEIQQESLSREYEHLQRRFKKHNGFYWYPLMYEGRRKKNEQTYM